MRYLNETVIRNADISSDIVSGAINTSNLFRMSYQVIATGSPNAVIRLQGSNDVLSGSGMNINNVLPTNWTNIPNTSQLIKAAGSYNISSTEVCYMWCRVYITAGGTGTVTSCTVQSQGF